MNDYTMVFMRHEQKYLLSEEQVPALMDAIGHRLVPDQYGESTIHSLYFDTPTDRLIRQSLTKPVYKEKLRIRAYGTPTAEATVFCELKKKYKGVVFKRREAMPLDDAMRYLCGEAPAPVQSQIIREIDRFCEVYKGLRPTMLILYDRQAFFDKDDPLVRITFDRRMRYDTARPDLTDPRTNEPILPEGQVLMEIKCTDAMPLWLVKPLSAQKIYPSSFSKYGEAYIKELKKKRLEEV